MSSLAELRVAAGMTQKALADKLKCGRRSVAAWELKETRPLPIYIERLTKLFHVTADELDLKATGDPPML